MRLVPSRAPALLAVGCACALAPPAAVAAPGDLDTGFGSAGRLDFRYAPGDHTIVGDVAAGGGGTTLVAGSASREADGWVQELAVARLTATGTEDTTFGGDGVVVLPEAGYDLDAVAVARDALGRVVLAGNRRSVARDEDGALVSNGLFVARLNADGSLDTTFGTGGLVHWDAPAGESSWINDMALAPDGRVVVALELWGSGSDPYFTLMRFEGDGDADPTFGVAGQARLAPDADEGPRRVEVQPDGRILTVAGGHDASGNGQLQAIRVTEAGALDASFGTGGVARTAFGAPGADDASVWPYALALQADGAVVVAGQAYRQVDGEWVLDGAFGRFEADGDLDPTFDGDGMARLDTDEGHAMTVEAGADGTLLFAGYARAAGAAQLGFALGRLTSGGAFDPSFAGDGLVATEDDGNQAWDLAVQGGHAVIGASAPATDGTYVARLYRYRLTAGS